MAIRSDGGKKPHGSIGGLPRLIGAVQPPSQPRSGITSLADKMWATSATAVTPRPGTQGSARVGSNIGSDYQRCSSAPSSASERPGSFQIMQWIDKELSINGCQNTAPSYERVRVFSSAFSEVIDMLPSYRMFLLALQKEYDGLIARLQAEINAIAPLEGRMKTMKAESFSFVGESMTWFQMEISMLRRRLSEVEAERNELLAEKKSFEDQRAKLIAASVQDKYMATESHSQNLDILKHLERMEKQVELLRKQEKEILSGNKELESKLKERDSRIQTLEEQLNEERESVAKMVPREDFEGSQSQVREWEARYKELEQEKNDTYKDYLSIVTEYQKKAKQDLNVKEDMRPLTPRPRWRHCKGLLDPKKEKSLDKAENAQALMQHLIVGSRTLLSAYGLSIAAKKSPVLEKYSNHPLAFPLSCADVDLERTKPAEENEPPPPSMDDMYLMPDMSPDTPEQLRHEEKARNTRMSRRQTSEFIEKIMQIRLRAGYEAYEKPFLAFMLEHLYEDVGDDTAAQKKAQEYAINVLASVRRFAKEPDFLAFLLLLTGKLTDTSVKANKDLTGEVVRIFASHFETEGAKMITKHRFFYGLREVLQNKDQKMWQDLVTYFPTGGPDILVNYETLLLDDMYVLSPITYALRLQHLEETLAMAERLEEAIRGTMKPGATIVAYHKVKAALADDPEFSLLLPEDYAKAFCMQPMDLKSSSEQDANVFLELMRHGDAFHIYFPVVPSDDQEIPTGEM